MPQNAAAIQFQPGNRQRDRCTLIVHWSPPNNYDVNNIKRYVIRSSHGSNMEMRHYENSTLVGFYDSCSKDLHINITIVDLCGRINSTADFKPDRVPLTPSKYYLSTRIKACASLQ